MAELGRWGVEGGNGDHWNGEESVRRDSRVLGREGRFQML